MRVLLLGDSHTAGSYGQSLEKLLTASGHEVTRVGRVGATAASYLSGGWRKLQGVGDYDRAIQDAYDLTILTLGTNDAAALGTNFTPTQAAGNIRQLADRVRTGNVVYVGPPAFSDEAAVNYNPVFKTENLNSRADRVWRATAPLFSGAIDPRNATRPFVLARDIHLPSAGGAAWARYVAGQLRAPSQPTPAEAGAGVAAGGPGVGLIVAVVAVVLFLSRSKGAA